MPTTILSNKFELTIPQSIREAMDLHAGQKFTIINKGHIIELAPIPTIERVQAVLKGANPKNYRDHQDRV